MVHACSPALQTSAKWDQAKWDQAKWERAKWERAKWEWARWDRALWDVARTCVAQYAGTAVAEGAGLAHDLQVGHDARVGTGPPVLHRVAEAPPPRLAPPCTALHHACTASLSPNCHYASSRPHDPGQGRGPAELSGFRVLSELRHQTDTAELEELQAQHTAEVRSERTRVSSSNANGEFGYVFHGRAIRVYTFGDKRPCRAAGGARAARGAASQLFEHRL